MEDGSWTYIEFIAKNPNLDEIKQTWSEIVELLPDLGHPAKSRDEILHSKSRDEILHFDEDKIMQKLFELGKIKDNPKRKIHA